MASESLTALINETMASKQDVVALRSEMQAGFNRTEPLLLAKQEQRLAELETRMKKLEDALAVSPHEKAAIPWRLLGYLP